jgi:prophage regulatory protein
MVKKLLKINEVIQKTKLSRTTIWRLESANLFPRRLELSKRLVAWEESEINDWIQSKARKQNQKKNDECL